MKKVLLYFLFTIVHFPSANSQNSLVKNWDYRYGGADWDYIQCFYETRDGGFILGGFSLSGISGDKTQDTVGGSDYWIVKLDALGNKEWDKDFGGTGVERLTSLQQTTDGGYILGGYSNSGIGGDKTQSTWGLNDFWIVKVDSLGNKQWDKDFGGTGTDQLYAIHQTFDGGYLLAGLSESNISGDKTQPVWGNNDYWIVKTDALGIKQWDRNFGGTSYDWFTDMIQTADSGFIVGGWSQSGISGDKTQNLWGVVGTDIDFWIVKTDKFGIQQWDKDFGGTEYDLLSAIVQSADGGYLFAGMSESGISGDKTEDIWGGAGLDVDYWIVKTDALGNKTWDKDYGGTGWEDDMASACQTTDGGYLVAGTSYSGISGDKTESNLGAEQTWVIKTDSLGMLQWEKTVRTNTVNHNEIGLAIQSSDGCFVFANSDDGVIGGDKSQDSRGFHDYWIIKFCDSIQCNLLSPPITQNGDTLFVPSVYTTYQWFHNSAAISGATNYFYVAPASGNYNIIVTDSNECSVGAGIINVVANVAPSPKGEGRGEVFPNPTIGSFEIKYYAEKNTLATIEIINTLGEIIYKKGFQVKQGMNSLSPGDGWGGVGIYFLLVQTDKGCYRQKIVRSQ